MVLIDLSEACIELLQLLLQIAESCSLFLPNITLKAAHEAGGCIHHNHQPEDSGANEEDLDIPLGVLHFMPNLVP